MIAGADRGGVEHANKEFSANCSPASTGVAILQAAQ